MIQLPRRSVTRFFIPLVDVLTLLFCVFLIMQAVSPLEDDAAGGELAKADPAELARRSQEQEAELKSLRKKLEDVSKNRVATLSDWLDIRVLEFDPDNGRLFYNGREIAGQADADRLIRQHKDRADGRKLYYLFLLPRGDKLTLQNTQLEEYERWFKGVEHGVDNPRASGR